MDWSVARTLRKQLNAGRSDATMMVYEGGNITWGQMHSRAAKVAQALLAEGVTGEDRIAFLDKNGPEFFEVLFGGGMINAVNVAINWRLAPPEVEYTLNDAGARVLFVGPEFVRVVDEIEGALQTVKKIVVLGDSDTYETFESWIGGHDAVDPETPTTADDIALQLYTSGTTGLPKGAMLTNTNLGALMDEAARMWRIDSGSTNVVCMPLFHIGGSGWALVGMWAGVTSLLYREFDPMEILEGLTKHKVTNALFVPAMLQFLCTIPSAAEGDYSMLRSIVYGASPITNDVLLKSMQTFGCDFIQVYGLTETTGAITQLSPEDHDPEGPRAHLLRSAGRPYPWVEMRVINPEDGSDQPPGAVGELWSRSVQNMKGYWNKPEANAAAFTDDGWFKTGDAGYLDEEGFVFLTDRVKDMIVSGGENVYPAEIENVLSLHPAIADVAVIGVPDDRWGETVKAVVVLADGSEATAQEIISYSRERLAGFKCPTSVDFTDVLPRNPSGKLLKRELRDPYWVGRERNIN
ncbi:MAG TPA: long-chain-fatty-acid--CoA ligase [Acidimicrobiales bacterium]|nr:long-chain-fatty-acid--CoA ligase [Acidimicrobiales bacterium]